MMVRLYFPLIATLCIFATWPVYAPVPEPERKGSVEDPQTEPPNLWMTSTWPPSEIYSGAKALQILTDAEQVDDPDVVEMLKNVKYDFSDDTRTRLLELAGGSIQRLLSDYNSLLSKKNLSEATKSYLENSIHVRLWAKNSDNIQLEVRVPVGLKEQIKIGDVTLPRVIYTTLVLSIPYSSIRYKINDLSKEIRTRLADIYSHGARFGKTEEFIKESEKLTEAEFGKLTRNAILPIIKTEIVTSCRSKYDAEGSIRVTSDGWTFTISGNQVTASKGTDINLKGTLDANASNKESAVFRISRAKGSYRTNPGERLSKVRKYDYRGTVTVSKDGTVQIQLYSYGGKSLYLKRSFWPIRIREIWTTRIDETVTSQMASNCGSSFQ